jgi:hypothetical protein
MHDMKNTATRSIISFEPDLHRALRIKAEHTQRSLSHLVNEAVRLTLQEDQSDLEAFDERVEEPLISYEALLKALKKQKTKNR